MADETKALVIRKSNGQIAPGSPPPANGRPRGTVNTVRGWMKAEYVRYCEEKGAAANLLLFYEEIRMNDKLPIQLRMDAAKALDRIVFPISALAAPEKDPHSSEEQQQRIAQAQAAVRTMMQGFEPNLLEAGPHE